MAHGVLAVNFGFLDVQSEACSFLHFGWLWVFVLLLESIWFCGVWLVAGFGLLGGFVMLGGGWALGFWLAFGFYLLLALWVALSFHRPVPPAVPLRLAAATVTACIRNLTILGHSYPCSYGSAAGRSLG